MVQLVCLEPGDERFAIDGVGDETAVVGEAGRRHERPAGVTAVQNQQLPEGVRELIKMTHLDHGPSPLQQSRAIRRARPEHLGTSSALVFSQGRHRPSCTLRAESRGLRG